MALTVRIISHLFCYSTITCGIIAWIQFFVRNTFLSNRIWGEYLFRYHWRKSNVGPELWVWKFGQKLLSARELLAFFGLFSKRECLLRLSHLYVFFPNSFCLSRCSFCSLCHRPSAMHWIRDGFGLEGSVLWRGKPCTWLLSGPEGKGHGNMERGQRQTCQRAPVQGG